MTHLTRRRGGFTLIEMVLVLIILATIAGLVISQLGFLGRSADMAATAKTQQDIANQLNLYFVLQKRMPQRMDSLLETDGTAPTGMMRHLDVNGAVTTSKNDQRWGFPLSGANGVVMPFAPGGTPVNNLAMITLDSSNGNRSFTRLGFDAVVDHVALNGTVVTNANDSGSVVRSLGSSTQVAGVVEGSPLARQMYPLNTIGQDGTTAFANGGGFPRDVASVVAVGVGPACTLIPDTMLAPPAYPGSHNAYYGRYIAYFACFKSGERAQLVGVSDSYGRFLNYSIQQFNESLPNNARQG